MTRWNYYPAGGSSRRGNKYGASKVTVDGVTFDSKKEARRWQELKILEKAGKITSLRRQVKFVLIPTQRGPEEIGPKGGRKPGKLLEKECSYIADHVYLDQEGKVHVEDTKGVRTEAYRIKKKLMLFVHGIIIEEV